MTSSKGALRWLEKRLAAKRLKLARAKATQEAKRGLALAAKSKKA